MNLVPYATSFLALAAALLLAATTVWARASRAYRRLTDAYWAAVQDAATTGAPDPGRFDDFPGVGSTVARLDTVKPWCDGAMAVTAGAIGFLALAVLTS